MSWIRQALAIAIGCTVVSGIAGGLVGWFFGAFTPSFLRWLLSTVDARMDPGEVKEFGVGLGALSGLFLGAGLGMFLVLVQFVRDLLTGHARVAPTEVVSTGKPAPRDELA